MKNSDNLSEALSVWLQQVVAAESPVRKMAVFRFGLSEADEGYVLYLAGSLTYSAQDDEWATDIPDFVAKQELLLPAEEETEWYWLLLEVIYWLSRLLRASYCQQSYLGNTPIYTGFVDGDLYRLT